MTECDEDSVELVTINEAAKMLRISRTTLFVLRNAGKIPFVKVGERIVFKKKAIIDYINDNELIYDVGEN